jgi:pimeloyl-ACP methyl ester carboxylesterase
MADFPFKESDNLKYDGPTLFVRGTRSHYVSNDTVPAIKKFFPNAQIADVEAGHWLISENPEAFRQGKLPWSSVSLKYMLTRWEKAVVKFLEKV